MLLDNGKPETFAKVTNEELLRTLYMGIALDPPDVVVIEWSAPRGMPASAQFLESVWWSGRFVEAASREGGPPVKRVERTKVKLHLCGQLKAKDSNIIAALIDRYGGTGGKAAAVGLKATPGPLYGVHDDVWQALAVAVTYLDTEDSM